MTRPGVAALDPLEPLWRVADAALFLRLSEKTVYRRARQGLLPCYAIVNGGRKATIRFSPKELATWVETRKVLRPGAAMK